ncbi:MAG: hypothetical protein RLZZ502_1149 [Pseudomonadota bacterium]
MRWILRTVACLTLLVVFFLAFMWWSLHQAVTLPEAGIEYKVNKGQTIKSLSQDLAARGIIPHASVFYWTARVHEAQNSLRAGTYLLKPPLHQLALLQVFIDADLVQSKLTLIEGHTVKQALKLLSDTDSLSGREQISTELVAKHLGLNVDQLEGQLMADTYVYAQGQSALQVVKQAHEKLQQVLAQEWEKRQPDLPYASAYEALIMASIVEKETGRSAERPYVASVFVNRLRLGMRLQTDPTVIYGMGEAFEGNIRKRDLQTDTPYNTYTRAGLPPTPIAMPGRESIRAALHPAATDYLYFVARGDGSSEFSSHLSAHNRAVQKYQLGR